MVLDFTEENFEKEVLKAEGLVLVDFWAPWCPPCRLVKPMIESLANTYQKEARIGQLNVDENRQIAQKYQIMSIPTLLFFKKGKIVDKLVGAQPENKIRQKLDQLL